MRSIYIMNTEQRTPSESLPTQEKIVTTADANPSPDGNNAHVLEMMPAGTQDDHNDSPEERLRQLRALLRQLEGTIEQETIFINQNPEPSLEMDALKHFHNRNLIEREKTLGMIDVLQKSNSSDF